MFIYEFLAPIIEVVGLVWFIILILQGDVNWKGALYIFLYSYSFAIAIGTLVILYDNFIQRQYKTLYETFKLWILIFVESFLYHPLLAFFALKGYFTYFTSKEVKWGTMTRQGVTNLNQKKKVNEQASV